MCGIVGYVGARTASQVLVDGLKRLEYRGYDSSGIAVLNGGGIQLRRAVGKISNLETVLKKKPVNGFVGLGLRRWATHGIPSEENAHPHTDCKKRIVVVHNGIIENFMSLKSELRRKGHKFASQTDTEVIAHLLEEENKKAKPKNEKDFFEVVRKCLKKLEGAFALSVMNSDFPGVVVAARRDCPLVIGLGEQENFVASDVPALLPYTRKTIILDQGELALLTKIGVECFSENGVKVTKAVTTVSWDLAQAEKSGFKHFMLKEIMEQPSAIEDTLRGRIDPAREDNWFGQRLSSGVLKNIKQITLVACGTSYHAALVGRFWLEALAKIPCRVEIASEFRYRPLFLQAKNRDLMIFISQSGETADTLAALRLAKKSKVRTLAICNVLGSTITNVAESTFYTHCGPEIGVASTKAFTGQLAALLHFALRLGRARGALSVADYKQKMRQLVKLPIWIRESIAMSKKIESLAARLQDKSSFLYLGRNLNYPMALEGALKLKEISYIHAEGYPAGELKHGPIALIDANMPIVAIATESQVYEKVASNIQEAKARGGHVVAIVSKGDANLKSVADDLIEVPRVPEIFSPIVNAVPLQLLAYHIAVLRGCDVDQPRNLAKSVTVE